MNRTLVFLSIILIFILLAGGVYFFVLRDTNTPTNPNNPSFNIDGTPVEIPGGEDDIIIDPTTPTTRTTLTQIHTSPVAGAHVYTNEIEVTVASSTETISSPLVTYVDKQTGHIFEYDPEVNEATRISNTTFPGIQEVNWFTDPTKLVFRYLNSDGEIETYLGDLSSGSLSGSYLEVDVPTIATFENQIINASVSDRGSDLYLADVDGTSSSLVYETPLTSILVPSFGENFIAILNKPVSSLAGALYFFEDGDEKRILGNKNGLTTLPNKDGSLILYSESTDRGFTTSLLDREENETKRLPLSVLPEKCVWHTEDTLYCMVPEVIPPANYPEHWYQGFISFTDALWEIDTRTGIARAVAFFDESGPFDGTNLSINEEGEYLTFINRRDGTLWGFDL
ncbi:MAG: hypothetical protein ACJKSS_00730 [Patescibacteria group bacterium UBA2103]